MVVILEVTFVGTGSGKTQLKRFHTSLLINNGNYNVLIDSGDGISKALLNLEIDLKIIDSIFITHTHADHFSGIASLLTQMKMADRTKPLNLYIHKTFVKFATNFLNYSFLFPETFNFEFKIIGFNSNAKIEFSDDFHLFIAKNNHIFDKHKLNVIPESRFISNSVLIKSKNCKIHYSSDIGLISDLSLFSKFKPNVLIVESTHIPFNEIIEFLKDSEYQKVYFVHINDEDKIVEQHSKLSNQQKKKYFLTFDGMQATMPY